MFIQSNSHPFGRTLSLGMARSLTILLYAGYPLGCVLQIAAGEGQGGGWLALGGLALIVVAVVAFVILATSSLQRLAQEPESKLDEREMQERNRAAFIAHGLFSAVVMGGLFFMMVRADLAKNGKAALWGPTDGDHWNALMFGAALLSLTLPAAVLAWTRRNDALDEG